MRGLESKLAVAHALALVAPVAVALVVTVAVAATAAAAIPFSFHQKCSSVKRKITLPVTRGGSANSDHICRKRARSPRSWIGVSFRGGTGSRPSGRS